MPPPPAPANPSRSGPAAPKPAAGHRLEYAIPLAHHGWLWYALFLCLLVTVWFIIVLYGEVNNWTERPDRWTGASTQAWALLGMAVLLLSALFFVLLLIRREVPQHRYVSARALRSPPPASGAAATPRLSRTERRQLKAAEQLARRREKQARRLLEKEAKQARAHR